MSTCAELLLAVLRAQVGEHSGDSPRSVPATLAKFQTAVGGPASAALVVYMLLDRQVYKVDGAFHSFRLAHKQE